MRVLVVEDNALLRHHLKVQIQDAGHQVDDAEDAKEADYYLNEHLPDIAIVDLGLPDEDGLSLISFRNSINASICSGFTASISPDRAHLTKPC